MRLGHWPLVSREQVTKDSRLIMCLWNQVEQAEHNTYPNRFRMSSSSVVRFCSGAA